MRYNVLWPNAKEILHFHLSSIISVIKSNLYLEEVNIDSLFKGKTSILQYTLYLMIPIHKASISIGMYWPVLCGHAYAHVYILGGV